MIAVVLTVSVLTQTILKFGLTQEVGNVEEICQDVKDSDDYLCQLLHRPEPFKRNKIFPSIREYIRCFDRLANCLHAEPNKTLEVCEEVFQEQGANFMHIRFDRDDLINGFLWNETDMAEYEKWRGKTLDAWLKCEKFIYRHSSFEVF
uniref:Uncharacterized protein n=1 Tax=Cuerna arida TaxID=1464854 RepID=A0A1B6G482_9HEMI